MQKIFGMAVVGFLGLAASQLTMVTPTQAAGNCNGSPQIRFLQDRYEFQVVGEKLDSTGAPVRLGGKIDSCQITPELPNGLTLNQRTCEISGIALENPGYSISYRVIPYNVCGAGTPAEITIAFDTFNP